MNNVFCSAPWTSLFIDTDGSVKPCCASKFPLGNINNQSINNILNGNVLSGVKKELLEGKKPEHCQYCYESERVSGTSTRLYFNENAPISDPSLEIFQLKQIDIRWSNHCNLRCLYCTPQSSSSIAEFYGIKEKLSNKQWQRTILDFIKSNVLTIEHVFLVGGEPLLLKENNELLDIITDQHIEVITNLSLVAENNTIFKKLLKKDNVHFNISLEQIGDKFQYVRNNAKWNTVMRNIEILKENRKSFSFHMVYCLYSALDLYTVLKELCEISNVIINPIFGLNYLDVNNHKQEIKDICLHEIDKILKDTELCHKLNEQVVTIESLRETLIQSRDTNLATEFIDSQKGNPDPEGFQRLWPEIWEILSKDS